MESKRWLKNYPEGVPSEIDTTKFDSLAALLESGFTRHADKVAYVSIGKNLLFREWGRQSEAFAAYLQSLSLKPGDRVAVMLPNIFQSPIAVAAILRAGMVVVNVNPLYTAGELRHQLIDSGAKAIIVLENFGHVLEQAIGQTAVDHVIVASMGDRLGVVKGTVVNYVVRHRKKLVPDYNLPGATKFNHAMRRGMRRRFTRPAITADDVAVLQYTGGTTGTAVGAVLLHRTLIAALLSADAWVSPAWVKHAPGEQNVVVCALPLYHVFSFVNCSLLGSYMGGKNILIPNARDIPALINDLEGEKIDALPAVNTLFTVLARNSKFKQLDFSNLRISVGGGMAVTANTAARWLELTGCPICEGYGLTETCSAVACNPIQSTAYSGSVGLPIPNCDVKILDEQHREVAAGAEGQVAVKGPMVMAGYWQDDELTASVTTADGYFLTGDVGTMDVDGYLSIVDRIKDMILVSGFNVYPNEVENVVNMLPGVLECAVVGVKHAATGESVRLFVTATAEDPATEEDIRKHCRANLTGYKRPREIIFRDDLPKTNVGKILRRALRDE